LKQRVALRCELAPLNLSETAAYIAGRIRIAGGKPSDVFTREAIRTVHDMSRGIPRTINVICDNAMIGGFAAQVKPVGRAIVEEVCDEFDLRPAPATEPAVVASEVNGPLQTAREDADDRMEPVAAAAAEPAQAAVGGNGRKKRFSFF
jgi:hypothetical protein